MSCARSRLRSTLPRERFSPVAQGCRLGRCSKLAAIWGTPVVHSQVRCRPAGPPARRRMPVDPTIMASATQTIGQLPLNRIATHLHGGFTPWFSDGTPFQWFDPFGLTGASFLNVPGTNLNFQVTRSAARRRWARRSLLPVLVSLSSGSRRVGKADAQAAIRSS
jgi:hypothetical protein